MNLRSRRNISRTGPDPGTLNDFDPGRYLDEARRPADPLYVFGFGRRCVSCQSAARPLMCRYDLGSASGSSLQKTSSS